MSIEDDLLADLVDPADDLVDDDLVDDGAEATMVSPEEFAELVARYEALRAAAETLREQLLYARDRLADAEGELAIAEAKRAALSAPGDGAVLDPEHVTAREDVARRERAVARAGRAVGQLEQALDDADTEAALAATAVGAATPVAPERSEQASNMFPSVYEFVPRFLAKVYARDVGRQINSFRWCSKWWEHAEAVSRLEALWKAFETLRLDPGTGAAVWWRDFADPTMGALCGPEGPFKQCSDTQHTLIADLPTNEAPSVFLEQGPDNAEGGRE